MTLTLGPTTEGAFLRCFPPDSISSWAVLYTYLGFCFLVWNTATVPTTDWARCLLNQYNIIRRWHWLIDSGQSVTATSQIHSLVHLQFNFKSRKWCLKCSSVFCTFATGGGWVKGSRKVSTCIQGSRFSISDPQVFLFAFIKVASVCSCYAFFFKGNK